MANSTTSTPTALTLVLPERSVAVVIVESTLFLISVLCSLLGNTLVCLAIYRNPRLRSTTNLYVTALACTDMLTSSICTMMTSGVLITGRWMYGARACEFYGFFAHYLIYCSVFTMMLTAVNRYFRIVKPQLYKKIFTTRNSLAFMVVMWTVLAFFTALPVLAGLASFEFLPDFAGCGWHFYSEEANLAFNMLQSVLCSFVPAVIIVISYIKVARTIRQHNADIQDSLQSGGRISVEEIKITKTLFALVLGFALCWVPSFSIVVLVRIILSYTPHGVAFVAGYLLSLSSAINPFIYGAMNRPFRREFREILRCGRECSVGPETSSTRSTMVSRSGRN